MKAEETTLRELIKGEQHFVVPLYQRPYSWESRQLNQLWLDLLEQAELIAAHREGTHFLGSIVLAPSPQLMPNASKWIVVDGQQRLTTLMVALCALRDYQAATDPAAVDRINELHLVNKWQQGDMRYRRPNSTSIRTFRSPCSPTWPRGMSSSEPSTGSRIK